MVQEIILAAGCFWSVQYKFNKLKGVEETYVVYAGGQVEHPTYAQVCTGKTGHAEAVYIKYNDEILTTRDLINFFFRFMMPASINDKDQTSEVNIVRLYFILPKNKKTLLLKLKALFNNQTIIKIYQ